MKKKLLCLSFVILFGFAPKNCLAKYSGGNGSESNPYRISDAYDMNDIGLHQEDWASHFVLTNDIDLAQFTGTQFNIIGNDSNAFTGIFDGNDKTILNYNYDARAEFPSVTAIFSIVDDSSAGIKNLTLTDPNVIGLLPAVLVTSLVSGTMTNCNMEGGTIIGPGSNVIGGLVFGNTDGTIENCTVSSFTISGTGISGCIAGINEGYLSGCHASGSINTGMAGMLVGANDGGTISDCTSSGTVLAFIAGGLLGENQKNGTVMHCQSSCNVFGNQGAGGLVGNNGRLFGPGTITECFATGDVGVGSGSSTVEGHGGLVGINFDGTISNCYALGSVTGDDRVGGLVGENSASVSNCYSAGLVSGATNIGGSIGYDDGGSGIYTKCFWDSDVNPDVNGIGNTTDPNVIGKSTSEMQKESTFTDWDFIEIWNIGENQTYPFLRVYPAGDLNHDGRVDGRDLAIIAMRWLNGI